jgi:hypothetical protein
MQQPIVEEMRAVTQRFKAEELAIVRDFMRETKEVFERQVTGAIKDKIKEKKVPHGESGGGGGPVS